MPQVARANFQGEGYPAPTVGAPHARKSCEQPVTGFRLVQIGATDHLSTVQRHEVRLRDETRILQSPGNELLVRNGCRGFGARDVETRFGKTVVQERPPVWILVLQLQRRHGLYALTAQLALAQLKRSEIKDAWIADRFPGALRFAKSARLQETNRTGVLGAFVRSDSGSNARIVRRTCSYRALPSP